MTESDKLLCNFIAQNELQRQVCLAVSEIANSVRHFSVLASDARAHARSKDATAAGGPQHLYASESKVADISSIIQKQLEPNLKGIFATGRMFRHDLELLRLIITGPTVESLVLCLLSIFGHTEHAQIDATARHLLEALAGIVVAVKSKCPSATRGVFMCVLQRLISADSNSELTLMRRVKTFVAVVQSTGAVGLEEIEMCKRYFEESMKVV